MSPTMESSLLYHKDELAIAREAKLLTSKKDVQQKVLVSRFTCPWIGL